MGRRKTPVLTLAAPPLRLIVALALTFAFATGLGERAVKAQGLAELNLIPVSVSPTAVAVSPTGATFVVRVAIQASTFDFAPGLVLQVIDDGDFTEVPPDDWQCPALVTAGDTGTCTVTLRAAGGAVSSSEQQVMILADTTTGFGGTTEPIAVTYSDEPSYDPGPDGTVSWSQPSGTVGVDVTTGSGGRITVSGSPSGGPSEYVLLGQTIDITTAGGTCSSANPCTLVFRLDATEAADQLPPVTPANVIVLRNGDPVPDCGTPRCVDVRDRFANADIRLVVLADQVSDWNVAREPRKADCKQGGWRGLTRSNGQPFADQGSCVSHFTR